MSRDELALSTIAEASALIRKREVSPVELTRAFLDRIDAHDEVLWIPFDGTVQHAALRGRESQKAIAGEVSTTTAGGGTALYDAVLQAYSQLNAMRRSDPSGKRYGIVVLSDGQDMNSRSTLAQVQTTLQPEEREPTGIQIHTIGIGGDADEGVLKKIARAGHGRYWKGNSTGDMVTIYRAIVTYY